MGIYICFRVRCFHQDMTLALAILFPFWTDKTGTELDYPPEQRFFLGNGTGGEIHGTFNVPVNMASFIVTRNIWIR